MKMSTKETNKMTKKKVYLKVFNNLDLMGGEIEGTSEKPTKAY